MSLDAALYLSGSPYDAPRLAVLICLTVFTVMSMCEVL